MIRKQAEESKIPSQNEGNGPKLTQWSYGRDTWNEGQRVETMRKIHFKTTALTESLRFYTVQGRQRETKQKTFYKVQLFLWRNNGSVYSLMLHKLHWLELCGFTASKVNRKTSDRHFHTGWWVARLSAPKSVYLSLGLTFSTFSSETHASIFLTKFSGNLKSSFSLVI